MKKQITISICDLCKKETETKEINYPVIFHTEQTEGRGCEPYVSQTKIDVCPECIDKICVISAVGAMGFNEYSVGSVNYE